MLGAQLTQAVVPWHQRVGALPASLSAFAASDPARVSPHVETRLTVYIACMQACAQ